MEMQIVDKKNLSQNLKMNWTKSEKSFDCKTHKSMEFWCSHFCFCLRQDEASDLNVHRQIISLGKEVV